ncbi:COX15/CtaA family protein [Algivirga pacifica]|uniref:COX15/CtaA family protein n=1 Tax=Algivirga pacifica TaxID=1162670 RepID=A0ABP9DDE2_9BACT
MQEKTSSRERYYRRFGVITIVAVFFLILVGGIVRSTGSGLGCPDWPQCFGQWVPPTDISELPADYKTVFAIEGKQIADFSALKTWIEYVNRLVGVLIGLFVFITLLLSTQYWSRDRLVFWMSLAAFVLVGFNGWLGSVVVATHLKPVIITGHMLLALVTVGVLIFAVARSYGAVSHIPKVNNVPKINKWLAVVVVLSILQLVFGTQVRQAIDTVANSMGEAGRHLWIENTGIMFYIHRSFSIVVFLANAYLAKLIIGSVSKQESLYHWSIILLGLLGMEILTGVIMAYFAIPAFTQPLHLLLGALIFGLQFYLILLVNYEKVMLTTKVDKAEELETV